MMKKMRGYTLIEILIAMVVMSFITLGAASMTIKVSADQQWNRLFHLIEEEFYRVNMRALSAVSLAYEMTQDQEMIGDGYHLVFSKGDDLGFWYLESREVEGVESEREVVYQEWIEDEYSILELENVILSGDRNGISGTAQLGIVTWSDSFAQLQFSVLNNGHLFDQGVGMRFVLEDSEECESGQCFLSLQYLMPGSVDRRMIQFDLQKAIYRSFY